MRFLAFIPVDSKNQGNGIFEKWFGSVGGKDSLRNTDGWNTLKGPLNAPITHLGVASGNLDDSFVAEIEKDIATIPNSHFLLIEKDEPFDAEVFAASVNLQQYQQKLG